MDSIFIIIFIIVVFIIIVGIILYINRSKTGKGFDKKYNGNGEVIVNNRRNIGINKQITDDAKRIADLINSDVIVSPTTINTGELRFKHLLRDIIIRYDFSEQTLYPVIIFNNNKDIYKKEGSMKMYSAFDAYADFICNYRVPKEYSKPYNPGKDDVDADMQLAIQLSMAESSAPSDSGGASKSSGASFDVDIIYDKDRIDKTDTFTVNPKMKISELINKFRSKHNEFHFYSFIFAGKNLLTIMDSNIVEQIKYRVNIHASGFKILKNANEMIEYIKSITVNFTNKPLCITPFKLVVTIPSAPGISIVEWHKTNIGKTWNWKNIAEKVFNNTNVDVLINNINIGIGRNSVIFYHKLYLELFAECLGNYGIEYNTPEKLLNLISTFFNPDQPNFNTKMTIVNALFGDLLGGGEETYALSEENIDQNVINAFNQYLDMHDPNSI